jgi:uncharacterized protein (DUF2147 family)
MRIWFPALLVTLLAVSSPAWSAPDATGEWRVENGDAHIRIVDCGGILWGVVSWERTPGLDSHNPDKAKRGQPMLGIPILRNMKPGDDPGQWEGEVYNAENGKTYDASIELREDGALRVEGCTLGVLCGGEDWKRLVQPQPAQAQTSNRAGTTGASGALARPADADICTSVARRPH